MTLTTTPGDLARMRQALLFSGPGRSAKLSRFWALLLLAAVIASAGVVGDSTATVIGAMIVAPLMTPIMGTVLSIVTADRVNLVRSVSLVLGGALAAIGIGWAVGKLAPIDVVAATSSQVAGRVSPRVIDLVAALATGAVGAFAQCREDVADTLPGVAIAISLVPPLTVVGLTAEAGEYGQSAGALLLFLTNVAAILVMGCLIMSLYRVFRHTAQEEPTRLNRRHAVAVVVALTAVIAVPLVVSSVSMTLGRLEEADIASVADDWAGEAGWSVVSIDRDEGEATVTVLGPLPAPDTAAFRRQLDAAGLADLDVRVRLVPQQEQLLPGR